jgi:ferredoxin
VDCIHWVDYTELRELEIERQHQVITLPGDPIKVSTKPRRKGTRTGERRNRR